MSETKVKLLRHCNQILETRQAEIKQQIAVVQQSANEETKSSAGDKYETGRAMAQLEIEKLVRQQAELGNMKRVLDQLKMDRNPQNIGPGSLVYSNDNLYFISIPLGKIELEDGIWFCISPASPIGSLLMGKKNGDRITWNGKPISIGRIE